jgi:hypothetical protein
MNRFQNDFFNFNLRRYAVGEEHGGPVPGGAVQVDSIKTRVESAPGFSA